MSQEQAYEILRSSTAGCQMFTLAGEIRYAKVVSVYDGDTCRMNFFMREGDMEPIQMSVRLSGIDTPERTSHDPQVKQLAERAREVLRSMLLNRIVRIEMEGLDKYGRVLSRVHVKDSSSSSEFCVNDWILTHGYGVKYGGGKKEGVWSKVPSTPAVETCDIV